MQTSTPSLSANGTSGELRYGYHVAARFGAWSLTVERGVETSIVIVSGLEPDGYWFEHRPQALRLTVGTRVWAWREAERVDHARYRVTGDPEVM